VSKYYHYDGMNFYLVAKQRDTFQLLVSEQERGKCEWHNGEH